MAMPLSAGLGRRIYIHEESLRALAADVAPARAAVASLLLDSWVYRVVVHHLDSLASLDPALSQTLSEAIEHARTAYGSAAAAVLRGVAVHGDAGSRLPLLSASESVHATCFESGYYTFATDEASACAMFDDHEPLARLYTRVVNGHGPDDLSIVRGSRLTWTNAGSGAAVEWGSVYTEATDEAVLAALVQAVEQGRRQAYRHLARLGLTDASYTPDHQ